MNIIPCGLGDRSAIMKKMIAFLIISYTSILCVLTNSEKNYGTFNLTISHFEICRGPKHKNCTNATAQINGYNTILYDVHVFQNVLPAKGKITAVTNGKEFLRLQMKKPCDHLFMRPLFHMLLNVTKDCIILKGHYRFSVDLMKIAQTYYDGAFLFGNWTFKSVFYNDDCNFSCAIVNVQMSPRDKNV